MTLIKKQLCSCGAGRDADRKLEDHEGNMYFLCGDEECKKQFLEELDDYEFRATHQGRRRSSYESSFDAIMYVLYVGGIIALFSILYWLIDKI